MAIESTRSADERLIAVETSLAHLQHQVDQMHEVMLAQQTEIEALRREMQRMQGKIERLDEPQDPHDLQAERPPHY